MAHNKNKWIYFNKEPRVEGRKTDTYTVWAREGNALLGVIKWFGNWRRYSFFPAVDTVFEETCLRDIADFCKEIMGARVSQSATPSRVE